MKFMLPAPFFFWWLQGVSIGDVARWTLSIFVSIPPLLEFD